MDYTGLAVWRPGLLRSDGLPDLEHAKTAVLNSLSSASGQRTYKHAIREVALTRTRLALEVVGWYLRGPRQHRQAGIVLVSSVKKRIEGRCSAANK